MQSPRRFNATESMAAEAIARADAAAHVAQWKAPLLGAQGLPDEAAREFYDAAELRLLEMFEIQQGSSHY
eukprot:4771896-Pyramimonas_sp.AAC.1